jgi:hypothetical protein
MFDPQDLLAVGVRLAGIERGELAATIMVMMSSSLMPLASRVPMCWPSRITQIVEIALTSLSLCEI